MPLLLSQIVSSMCVALTLNDGLMVANTVYYEDKISFPIKRFNQRGSKTQVPLTQAT